MIDILLLPTVLLLVGFVVWLRISHERMVQGWIDAGLLHTEPFTDERQDVLRTVFLCGRVCNIEALDTIRDRANKQ